MPDSKLTPEAEAALGAEVTAHAQGATPDPVAAAAGTAAAMTERGPTLPAEEELNSFMARMQADYARMAAELETLKTQQAQALAGAGGPLTVRYAQGAADKVAALVAAHPDAPQGHFAALTAAAEKLHAEAQAVAKGGGALGVLQDAAAAVERFALKTHPRAWRRHIDWSAILDDAETAAAEAVKLAGAL